MRSRCFDGKVVDFRLFRYRNFAIMNATSCVFAVAWFGMFFVFTQFLRNAWDYELLKAGLLVSPVPFGAGVLAPIGGRVADRLGCRPMMIAGAIAYGLGALWSRTFDRYLRESGDLGMLETIAPFFAWRALVVSSPRWYPHLRAEDRDRMLRFAERVLAAPRFDPAMGIEAMR